MTHFCSVCALQETCWKPQLSGRKQYEDDDDEDDDDDDDDDDNDDVTATVCQCLLQYIQHYINVRFAFMLSTDCSY